MKNRDLKLKGESDSGNDMKALSHHNLLLCLLPPPEKVLPHRHAEAEALP